MKLHINFTIIIIETYRLGPLTGFYHSCFLNVKLRDLKI